MTAAATMDDAPWSKATVLSCDAHTRLTVLDDGRILTLPAPRTDDLRNSVPTRRFAVGRTPRFVELNGWVAAVAGSFAVHDVDLAIMAALGVDVEADMALHRDSPLWVDPDRRDELSDVLHVGRDRPSHVMDIGKRGRLGGSVDLGDGASYSDGAFILRMRFPDAVLATLEGRPLHQVASIPSLSHLNLPITWVGSNPAPFGSGWVTTLEVCDEEGWRLVD